MVKDFSQLKVGNKVAVYSSRYSRYSTLTVDRITDTQIVCYFKNSNGDKISKKFKKSNGYEIGGDTWYSQSIEILTDDIIYDIEINSLRDKTHKLVSNIVLDKYSKEQLIKICEAIEGK